MRGSFAFKRSEAMNLILGEPTTVLQISAPTLLIFKLMLIICTNAKERVPHQCHGAEPRLMESATSLGKKRSSESSNMPLDINRRERWLRPGPCGGHSLRPQTSFFYWPPKACSHRWVWGNKTSRSYVVPCSFECKTWSSGLLSSVWIQSSGLLSSSGGWSAV